MTEQRPKRFPNQQARKEFFCGRDKRREDRKNNPPYRQQPRQQPPPQSANQGPPSSQPTLQPTLFMSQEQVFERFRRFHEYQSEQLRIQGEQLQRHQEWGRQQFENLSMMSAAVPSVYNQPVNHFPQAQHGSPVAPYIPRHPPWTGPPHPPGYNTLQPYPMSQSYAQEPPITKDQHVSLSSDILNPDVIRCEEVDDDTSSKTSTTKTNSEASTACPPLSSASSFSKAQDSSQEPNLKRKPSTENTDKLKEAKINRMQSKESETNSTLLKQPEPTVDDNNSNKTVGELNQSWEDDQSPGVHEASMSEGVANTAAEPQNTTATVEPTRTSPPTLNPLSRTADQKDITRSSSTTSESRSESLNSSIKLTVSSNSSIEGSNSPPFSAYGLPDQSANRRSLDRNLELARCKLDSPDWKNGVLLGDFVCFTKDHFNDLDSSEWYSSQTILAWRASVEIPPNWIVVVHDEDPNRHPISEGTTDIIRVNFEAKRNHWTLTHLSINNWKVTYYDSYLGKNGYGRDASYMAKKCNKLVHDVRHKHPKPGVTMPTKDPPTFAQCTIPQDDYSSCGPYTLREAEKLLGFHVDDDQKCPLAIRCRHVELILKAVSKVIDKHRPLSPFDKTHSTSDLEEIAPPVSSLHNRPSPEIDCSTAPVDIAHIDNGKKASAGQGSSKSAMLRELESSLNVREIVSRPRISYRQCYRVPLAGVDDRDIGTIEEDSSDDYYPYVGLDDDNEDSSTLNADNKQLNYHDAESPSRESKNAQNSANSVYRTMSAKPPQSLSVVVPPLSIKATIKPTVKNLDELAQDVSPRPTEEEIANLTDDQKRRAWKTIPLRQLRRVPTGEMRSAMHPLSRAWKDTIIEGLLRHNTPFPLETQWHFLLPSKYAGWSREDLETVRWEDLRVECHRLRIAIPKKVRGKDSIIDQILLFNESGGACKDRPRRRTSRRTIKMFKGRTFEEARLKEQDDKRLMLPKDPNLPRDSIDPRQPALIIIVSRASGHIDVDKCKHQHAEAKRCLESELILGRLENATYVDAFIGSRSLVEPLPLYERRQGRQGSMFVLTSAVGKAQKGTQIIFVSMGIDGISCNEAGWKKYSDEFEIADPRQLKIYLVIAESITQWRKCEIIWSDNDWNGPIGGRYWACCPLRQLLETETNIRLFQQIREQWGKFYAGRISRRRGIYEEGRPVSGRNGPRASYE